MNAGARQPKPAFTLHQSGLAVCRDRGGRELWRAAVGDPRRNGIVDVGINEALDGNLFGSNLYIGMIGATGFDSTVGLTSGDTMAAHAGWVEYEDYDESTRPQWNYGSAAGRSLRNASPAVFTFNETAVLKGFFVATSSTKGESASTLWATALFSSGDRTVVNGESIQFTYILSASQGG